jgi:hypothetical protein
MKRTPKILFAIALLTIGFLCFSDEPNDSLNSDYSPIEARIMALEDHLVALEDRIVSLELYRFVSSLDDSNDTPLSPADPNKNALRIKRMLKQIQEIKAEIVLNEGRIIVFPPQYVMEGFRRCTADELNRILKAAKENRDSLLANEARYKKILQIVERNPDLGLNVTDARRQLIDCQDRKKQADDNLDRVRELILRHRKLFNIVPR